ncbi:MAG TPA: HAMP domain-containing sensor histidine kinase [Roseiflexaceae bacterium]|nr:HAMP domain-containing sensor histidine kinase [Roseiflexaceae bacterium]
MTRLWRQNALYLPILVAALIALVLLAVLQYYWVGQVSAAEHDRMRATLRASAARFSEDFDRELARMYLSFQMDATTLRDRNWERYARRYDHWSSTAPYPGLVDQIYLVELRDRGSLHLQRFNPATRSFERVAWPAHMAGVWQRFMQSYRETALEGGVVVSTSPEPVAAEVPALLVPIARTWLLSDRQQLDFEASFLYGDTIIASADATCLSCEPVKGGVPLFAHTIVTLDRDYMQREFIPALARRYFAGDDRLDYHLTIVTTGETPRTIYRSDPQAPRGQAPLGDAVVDLLNVRLDELNRFLLTDSLRIADEDDGQAAPLAIGIVARNPHTAHESQGQWRLVITHRSGSLERALAELRARNLALSLGTLLLLAGSVILMIAMARRAQRLAQQKIDFVTVVSHELRTPLAVICSAGENLADGVIQEPEHARRYGAVIRGEGRRLAEMVEQVLEFAEIQSGRRAYELAPVDVADVVERALAACQLQIRASGAQVDVRVAPDLPPIQADARALRNAVQNLLSNAVKYGGARPWVEVRVSLVAGVHPPEMRIAVTDRGMGIPAEDLPHIFEPFYRGREVMAAQIHGSGLGLQLVRHILQAHGGRVSVESAAGRGSTFTLHLPVTAGAAGAAQPTTA